MTVLTKTKRFPRAMLTSELETLRDAYNNYWNADTDRSVVFAGGDDPIALKLGNGDEYSTLHYDTDGDFYYWKHDNAVGEEPDRTPEYAGYDGDDSQDHGYHECQNFA